MKDSSKLLSIFCEARECLSSEQRAAYLDEACRDDADLRARVEELLHAEPDIGNFLRGDASQPGPVVTVDHPIREGPGTIIGPYKLLEQIGEGGFGLVFMAEQQQPVRRTVALKILKPGMDTRQVIARFEAERQALALMDHPNIARVLDAGETASGRPHFVMELVRGVAITDYCDQNRLTTRERLELFTHVCQAVQHAHHKGIIHRDIKPTNVMVTLHDDVAVVKVIDFGIAKALGQQLTDKTLVTGYAQMVGTPMYMSPEQAQLSGLDIDTRSDIYSLGVLLYELLTGTTPFDKERLRTAGYDEMRRIIREEESPRPSTRVRTMGQAVATVSERRRSDPKRLSQLLRGELDWIVMKALEKDRNRRYETANELARDVQRYLHDEPVAACPPSAWYRFRKFARRNWRPLMMAAVVTALLGLTGLTLSIVTVVFIQKLQFERDAAEKAEHGGEHKLWLSYLSQAQARRMSRQSGQRFASLRSIKEALALPVPPGHSRVELRTEAIAALCLPDLELAREGASKPLGASGCTIDPAFQRYAWADKEGIVRICRLSDDEELLRLPAGGGGNDYGGLQFSPNGRFLHQICNTPRGLCSRLWDLDAPKPKAVLDDDHNGLAFRPDSREVAVTYRNDRTVRFLETASGRELRRFTLDMTPDDRDLHWNPKLPQLLVGSETSMRLLNVDTGAAVEVGSNIPGGHFSRERDWHSEGRLLAVTGIKDFKIYLWDVPTGRLAVPPLEDHKTGGVVMCFNHAGDRLLSTDWSDGWRLWDTRSGRQLLNLPALGTDLSFSPDDLFVGAGAGSTHRLYHFRRGEELRTLVHHGSRLGYAPALSVCLDPEGRLFAIDAEDGIAVVDVARGEEAALLPLTGMENRPLRFDREGALWTYGSTGLLRWRVTDNLKTGQRRYGPPQRILQRITFVNHGSTPDMRIVAIPQFSDGAVVFHRDSKRLLPLGIQEDVRSCAVSPDGRWVATGSYTLHEGAGVKVWDAQDGRHIKDLPVGVCPVVKFSPDGKWLLTTGGEPRLWAVSTWEEGPSLNGTPCNDGAFSRDDKLLALGDKPGVVRLIVTDTGVEIARLTVPEKTRLRPCCFTPDGTRLIAAGVETTFLYIFDLRAIRAGLSELDLDWDAPPFPAAPRGADAAPLSIRFEMGDIQRWAEADALVEQAARQIHGKEHAKGLASLRKAVKIEPSCAVAHNGLACLLLTGPKELRDPAQALSEVRKAVELDPADSDLLNMLGRALYYTGQFAEAIHVLERSLREERGQTDAFDLFFLAMCHHRLGDAARAKDCHERGKQWFQKYKGKFLAGWEEKLTAFQAESESVLAQPPGQAKK